MAQNTWINITADASTSNRPDHNSELHQAAGGTAASGALTVSFDSAVVTNLGTFDKMLSVARARAIAAGLK